MNRNYCYTIPEGEHKGETLWSGRYCCVCAIVCCVVDGRTYILANKRGKNCPDFQGYWNLPCGFLEADENGEHGCAREVLEETGLFTYPEKYSFLNVDTDPFVVNKGHVTINYSYTFYRDYLPNLKSGDIEEAAEVMWVPKERIRELDWAFNHLELLYSFL